MRPDTQESYQQQSITRAFDRLFGQWLPASGREPRAAPCLEMYHNSPYDTAPENLVTDVCVPLEPK